MSLDVFILAAGLGTRLKPLTLKYPKPAVPFLNVPLGFYQLPYLKSLAIEKIVFNTHHIPEKIKSLYLNNPYLKNHLTYSDEIQKIYGSAGGLKFAEKHFKSNTVLMLNADEVFFTSETNFLKKAYNKHLTNNNLATLIVTKHPLAGTKFGAIWCENDIVKSIGKAAIGKNEVPHHYIGAIFLDSSIFSFIKENEESNIFYDLLINHLNDKKVQVYEINCSWYETGNGNDYLESTKAVLDNFNESLADFINIYDKSSLIKNVDGYSLVSDSVQINSNKLIGYNVISASSDARLLKSEKIENSVIFDNEILNLSYFS